MTDNEIIKVLEKEADFSCNMCCNYGENCLDEDCASFISRIALDLINRQKELLGMAEKAMKIANENADLMREQYECVKVEVVREFAEKLKEYAFECDVSFGFGEEHCTKAVAVVDIERLVEEMTEDETQKQIDNAPIEDVVEVVRCKDCEYNNECSVQDFGEMHQNDFCSHGKRKELDNG